jgi:hypothetical protein
MAHSPNPDESNASKVMGKKAIYSNKMMKAG